MATTEQVSDKAPTNSAPNSDLGISLEDVQNFIDEGLVDSAIVLEERDADDEEIREILYRCESCFKVEIAPNNSAPEDWASAHFCSSRCERVFSIKQVKNIGVGQRFIHCTFDNFEINDANERAFMACASGVENLERGIFIHGSVGAGKTHLLTAMIHAMIEENIARPQEIMFVPILELLERVKASWERGERTPIEKLKKIPVLFIDDLGMEVVKDWAFQIFLNIVTYRYNADLPIFISSNLNEGELLDRYGTAVISRLAQMCEIVKLEAPNFRMSMDHEDSSTSQNSHNNHISNETQAHPTNNYDNGEAMS